MTDRVVLAIDPGLRFCGYGIIARAAGRLQHRASGHVETPTDWDLERRQRFIWRALDRLIRQHNPALIAWEDQAGVSAAARESQKRQVEAAKRGRTVKAFHFSADNDGVTEVVGIVKCLAFHYGIPLHKVQPRSAKVALLGPGHGSADKDDVRRAVRMIFRLHDVSEHGADAVAVGVTAERRTWLQVKRAG